MENTPKLEQQVYLQATDGSVWAVTVDPSGILHTEKVGSLPVPSPF